MGRPASATLLLWGPVALYMAAIFYVSHQPDVSIPGGFSDAPVHSVAYAGLAVTIVRALAGGLGRRVGRRTALAALAIAVAYGATDEWHQSFVPGRFAELKDLYANAIGASIGTALCWAWGIISSSRHGL